MTSKQAPSYPQDQTAWAVLDWSMRIVPRNCRLEMFLVFSLLVWLVDLAQLPDPSSLLSMLQHGFFLETAIFQKKKSSPSWPLHGLQLPSENVELLCCGILSRGCRARPAPPCFFLWHAGECLLWYLEHLLHWSWLCCGFSLPALLPMLCDILPFAFRGTASLADGLVFGLQWGVVWNHLCPAQGNPWLLTETTSAAATKILPYKPNTGAQTRFYTVSQHCCLCKGAFDCRAPSRVSNGFAMLLEVPPTWSSHVIQTGCALKWPASILVKAVWMSRRDCMWFCCERWQYTWAISEKM